MKITRAMQELNLVDDFAKSVISLMERSSEFDEKKQWSWEATGELITKLKRQQENTN